MKKLPFKAKSKMFKKIYTIDGLDFYCNREIEMNELVLLVPVQGQKKVYWIEEKECINSGETLIAAPVFTFTRVLTATDLGV